MNSLDTQFTQIANDILARGKKRPTRTGIDAITIPSAYIRHDMSDGFPLLTSRFIPFKSVKVELEFFIKGLTDKTWLQARGCKYWDEWCNPQKVPYSTNPETQKLMRAESDLGKVYGYQWRNYNSSGIDQLKNIVQTIKSNPNDRRMLCLAWNPQQINEMALPPCHFGFQVTVINGTINLSWFQRSTDVLIGSCSNIASYALLLHLLALETKLLPGEICGHLNDVHIYENQVDIFEKFQKNAPTFPLPTVETKKFTNIFDWEYKDTELKNYMHGPSIKYPVAI